MDVSLEKFNEPKWRCSFALTRLFFESGDIQLLGKRVRTFLQQGSIEGLGGEPDRGGSAWRSLELVRARYPRLKTPCHQPPVVWLRLGFMLQSKGVELSNSFIASYAEWRLADSDDFGAIRVQYRTRSKPLETWPLDYFLHGRNLEFEIPSEHEVTLVRSFTENSRNRRCSDIVGRHALALIRECINDAAVLQNIKGLTKETDQDRYICYLTREALADALQARYPPMRDIGVQTIIRSVGQFVACSRRRRL